MTYPYQQVANAVDAFQPQVSAFVLLEVAELVRHQTLHHVLFDAPCGGHQAIHQFVLNQIPVEN